MSSPGFKVTPAGAAAFAASEAGQPVALAAMAFGDANGVAYAPTGQETELRHEVARFPVSEVVRDPGNLNQLVASASLPEAVGGFQILEVAVYLSTGELAAIGPANVYKSQPADGVVTSLTVDAVFACSPAANVTVAFNDAALVTQAWVFQHRQFFAVASATATAPPAAPAPEDQYLLPTGCTGAWAGHDGQVALWRGAADGWLFITCPFGAQANAADTNLSWLLTTSGWIPKAGGFGAESTKASAATCDLGAAATHLVKITGSTAISSFGASAALTDPLFVGRLTGSPVLSNSAGLQLPGGADIAGAPGDAFMAQYLGGGAWKVAAYWPAVGYDRAGLAAAARDAATAAAKAYTDGVAALLAPLLSPLFTGTPRGPTAARGTTTTQFSTTAFASDLAGGNDLTLNGWSGSQTWTAGQVCGKGNILFAAGTYTLPPANSVAPGTKVSFAVRSAGVVIARQGGDAINLPEGDGTTGYAPAPGGFVVLESDGGSTWYVVREGGLYAPSFRGFAAGQTADRLNNSNVLATTAHVKSVGHRFRGAKNLSGDINDAGAKVHVGSNFNLPSVASVAGETFTYGNTAAVPITATCVGPDFIFGLTNAGAGGSIVLGPYETITLFSDGGNAWFACSNFSRAGKLATISSGPFGQLVVLDFTWTAGQYREARLEFDSVRVDGGSLQLVLLWNGYELGTTGGVQVSNANQLNDGFLTLRHADTIFPEWTTGMGYGGAPNVRPAPNVGGALAASGSVGGYQLGANPPVTGIRLRALNNGQYQTLLGGNWRFRGA